MALTAKDFRTLAGAIKDAREASIPDVAAAQAAIRRASTVKAQQDACEIASAADIQARHIGRVFDSLARTVAGVLATQNPKFQKGRFLRECGVSL